MYNKDREGTTLCSTVQERYHKLKHHRSKIPQTYKLEGNADKKSNWIESAISARHANGEN